jgi:hypothetical protein
VTGSPPTGRPRQPVLVRVLRTLPTGIAVLWIAGVAQFRDMQFTALDYAVLLAAAFALQVVMQRLRGRERPIVLPKGANPTTVAFLAAAITGTLALVIGGALELATSSSDGAPVTPWWLRTLWHGACAFGASYCRILSRTQQMRVQPPGSDGNPGQGSGPGPGPTA